MTEKETSTPVQSNVAEGRDVSKDSVCQVVYAMPHPTVEDDTVDLVELWRCLWNRRKLIVIATFLAAVVAAGVSLLMPNVYRSEILIAPVSAEGSKGGLSSVLGDMGGLAALAGISLPGGGGGAEENLAVLKSREFLWRFIQSEKLMPVLFEDKWDEENKRWRVDDPEERPSLWDAYRKLTQGGILNVTTDTKTNLTTIAIEWKDPTLSARWANALVSRLNEFLRQRALEETKANLKYLSQELARTQVEDVRKALFALISQEQKKAMLANTRVQYAFRVLDSAQPPDKKARPQRVLIVVLAAVVAGALSVVYVFVCEALRRRMETEGPEK